MPTINVSSEVWEAIAERGKFGESEDDVLRRVFKLPPSNGASAKGPGRNPVAPPTLGTPRRSFATQRMSSYINNDQLHISFAGGASRSWALPARKDKDALRSMREQAVSFAKQNGATLGQVNAVKKTLTEAGYHLTR